MQVVIWVAMMVATLLGTNFAQEWACWWDVWREGPVYVCEYVDEKPGGIYANVYSEDGVHVQIEINADPWMEFVND